MNTTNETAVLKQLADAAMNKALINSRETALVEEEKAKRLLEHKRNELLKKIAETNYEDQELKERDKAKVNRIGLLITLYDEQLVSLDTNLTRINSVITTNIDELFNIELRIVQLKKEWEALSKKSSDYAEDPVVIEGKKRPINTIDERRDAIELEINNLRKERDATLALLRELVKSRVENMTNRKVLENKLITVSEKQRRTSQKIDREDYVDKTNKALDEAELAVIEMGIKRRNEAIENLRIRPDKLLKKCLEALENNSPLYEELKAKLENLTKIRTVPKTPSNPSRTYNRELVSPSKLSLEEAIATNKQAVEDLIVNLVSLESEEISLLNRIIEKIYLQVKNRIILETSILMAVSDPQRNIIVKRSNDNMGILESQILATERKLVDNGITSLESKDTKRIYEEAISRDENELFLIASCRDVDAMSYSDLMDVVMAKHLSEDDKKEEENLDFSNQFPSYEEIVDEAREVYDIGPNFDFLAEEQIQEIEPPKLETTNPNQEEEMQGATKLVGLVDKLADSIDETYDMIDVDDSLALPFQGVKVDTTKTKRVNVSPAMKELVMDEIKTKKNKTLGGK